MEFIWFKVFIVGYSYLRWLPKPAGIRRLSLVTVHGIRPALDGKDGRMRIFISLLLRYLGRKSKFAGRNLNGDSVYVIINWIDTKTRSSKDFAFLLFP